MSETSIALSPRHYELTSRKWWSSRKKRYDIGLGIAAFSALIFFMIVLEYFIIPKGNSSDKILMALSLQALSFMVMLIISKGVYYSGPFLEIFFKPLNKNKFRKRLFTGGFWISCMMPFVIPFIIMGLLTYHSIF